MKRIYIQLVQTSETFKRQQETLFGKTVMNLRVEHCNAIYLQSERVLYVPIDQGFISVVKDKRKETEQLFPTTALGT